MKYLNRLWSNAGKTYSLKPKYYRLTTMVGLLGLFLLTIPLAMASTIGLIWLFGQDSVIAVVLILPVFVICLFVGLHLAALLFALILLLLGSMNRHQALAYVRYGQYPQHWHKDEDDSPGNTGKDAR